MAGLTVTERNTLLDNFGSRALFVSLHSADSPTGGNEISGGTPVYARKGVTWNAAANASKTNAAPVVFDVPGGGTTITHLGYWTASTGGTFLGTRPLDTSQQFATQGTHTIAAGGITENLVQV